MIFILFGRWMNEKKEKIVAAVVVVYNLNITFSKDMYTHEGYFHFLYSGLLSRVGKNKKNIKMAQKNCITL